MRHSAALFAVTLVLCSRFVAPSVQAQSSVWRVTADTHALYLGGTLHVLREQDFPLPAEFDEAFAAAAELWFEVDLDQAESLEALGLILRESVLPEEETLAQHLSAEAWQVLQDYCTTSGLSLATMERFTPGVLMMNIQMFELTRLGIHRQGVELHYSLEAKRTGKTTHGLETIKQQLGFINDLGRDNPDQLVIETIRQLPKLRATMEATIAGWRRGDLGVIDELIVQEMSSDTPEVVEKLLVQRNRNWIPQIEELLHTTPVEFVLVGAGHLPGEHGLLALLEARGYTIEQVIAGE